MPLRRSLFSLAALLTSLLVLCAGAPAQETGRPRPPSSAAPSPSPVPSASPAPALHWRSIGPAVSGGRVATVAGTDLDPALLYAGAAGGGVWRSTNAGNDWSPVFDKAGTQSIGAIAISPRDKNEVWVGTGEPWPRNDVIPGDGIYRSSDGGKNWTHLGLAATSQIARVILDLRDPKRVLVAALGDPFADNPERGVFRSTDGGATWTKTLYAGPAVGASDLAADPKNPDVLYAGMWRFRRSAWHLSSGGEDDGIYKSTDGGATWKRVSGNGLPTGSTGRIALAIAPSDNRRIYALIESKDGLLWRSDDGGASWKLTSSNTLINERPFYYSRVVVDPHDANHLFSVSVLLAESTNGGQTWHVSGRRLHGDHHDLWISANGRTILEANDGGVGLSHDGGSTWSWRNVLPIAQFYHVAHDLQSPYRICGGLQDNGSWCAPSRTGDDRGILPSDWLKVHGGDGTFVIPNPRDPQSIWSAAGGGDNQGSMVRYDMRTRNQTDVSPYLRDQNVVAPSRLKYRFNWETPIAFDPHDRRTVYAGGNVLFRTTDDGAHWTPISPDLTRNLRERQNLTGGLTLDVTGAETFDTILSVAPSPLAAKTIWVGTDDGVVQLTRDGGAHWANVSIPGVDADGRIPNLEASRHAAGTAYAAVDRHYAGDRAPYVYVTHDFGRTWRALVSGLPHSEVHVVREDPRSANLLYAGTGKGVWWSDDAGASWKPFPAPLPKVEVRDLAVQPLAGDLIAATHGRGIYVFDDLTALRAPRPKPGAEAVLFAPRDVQPLQRYTPTVNVRGASEDAPQASFTFWQAAPAKTAPALEIVDARGTVVRHISGTHDEAGEDVSNVTNLASYNRVAWDLGEDPPIPWRRVAKWNRGPDSGVPVLSGTYTVRLLRDGKTYAQKLRILPDRRIASARDELRGYVFQRAMFAELSRVDDALNGLDNVRAQLPERIAALKDAALAERARGVLAEAARLEAALSSQPANGQDNDFLEDLLRERVYAFIGNLTPGSPSGPQLAEGTQLQHEGTAALARYGEFVARRVQPLNDALRAAGAAPLDLAAIPPKTKPDPNADEHARRGEASE